MLYILLDNGHGSNTPGKRSPLMSNGERFFEWEYCREIVDILMSKFNSYPNKYKAIKITLEKTDIGLGTRVKRVNEYCKKYGTKNCIMLSVHVNAAGDATKWMSGRGWSAWTTKGKTNSDLLAECLYDGAEKVLNANKDYINSFKGQTIQKPIRMDKSDGDRDYEANFQILRQSNCPCVLTENMFMDNIKDVNYLLSPQGYNDIANIHFLGVENYYNKYKK